VLPGGAYLNINDKEKRTARAGQNVEFAEGARKRD